MPAIFKSRQGQSPLLISFPHDGIVFPAAMKTGLSEYGLANTDCDWFISKLYGFVEAMDCSYLKPDYSRYVVDLNRSSEGGLLYPGKTETGICPLRTFDDRPIYKKGAGPGEEEIQARIASYWRPCHEHINNELARIKVIHGYALLWDAHSIRAEVPQLFDGVLPDLNFGTNDGLSCEKQMTDKLMSLAIEHSNYSVVLNGRFKGGYITRHYGDPDNGIHTIQLEISQAAYLSSSIPPRIDNEKAKSLSGLLERLTTVFCRSIPVGP